MDFLIGCGSSVAADTGNSLLAKVKKHIGYLLSYNKNVKTLEIARDNLHAKISDANQLEADAGTSFRTVSSSVAHWKKQAERLCKDALKIISSHASNPRSVCPNPWARYSSSKEAWELTQEINEKVQTAPDFGTTFNLPVQNVGARFNLAGVAEFESQLSVLNGVLEALKDKKVSMCSICGMGGVGKTTLAKKLVQRVEADRLFSKVAMATVSQNPNPKKIQDEIIEILGLNVDEKMTARASKLNSWLADHSTLIVLDDVWSMLNDKDFEAIGIPLASTSIKIVLTSRNEDECIKMGSRPNFRINVLNDAEAWELFKQKADISALDSNLHETAREIALKCCGLPIAIVTSATALKGKPRSIWNDSLLKLRNSKADPLNVYPLIQLSYNLLNDQEAHSCFLLCCLFPPNYRISVQDMVLYGKGLQIFDNVDTMSQARDRVEAIFHKLKKSFLLLEGDSDEDVTMHDIIRDFAISISSKHEHPYLVKYENSSTQWPEKSVYENCRAISVVSKQVFGLPACLECPNLKLLRLGFIISPDELPDNFLEGAKELQVLSISVLYVSQSLESLKKLRTLHIRETPAYSKYRTPSEIGNLIHDNLKSLEALSVYSTRKCDNLIARIGMLRSLRFLDLSHMRFWYIPPGAFSNLVKLEELYLSWKFMHWGREEELGGRMNASLNEIESLPLTAIKIGIPKGSVLAEKFVRNLTRFRVLFGRFCSDFSSQGFSKQVVEIYDVEASEITSSWIGALLRKCERLRLLRVRNLKNIMCLLVEEDNNRSAQLKELYIRYCSDIEYLVENGAACFSELRSLELHNLSNLKEIIHCFTKIQEACFSSLSVLKIVNCHKLKHVLPLRVARELRQLQSMTVWNCEEMEEIFYKDEADDGRDDKVVSRSSHEAETELQLSRKAMLNHKPKSTTCPNFSGIFRRDKQSISVPDNQQVEDNTPKQSENEVEVSMKDAFLFPQLKALILKLMPKLRVFYEGNEAVEMPSLQELIILDCNNVEALSYGSFTAPKLQNVEINGIKSSVEGDLNPIVKNKLKGGDGDNEIGPCDQIE